MIKTKTTDEPQPTDEEWNRAGQIVLKAEREERGDPMWLPNYLNGAYEFGKRVRALIAEGRSGQGS